METRACKTCGVESPLTGEFFHRSKVNRGGFIPSCKECRSAISAARWKTIPVEERKRRGQAHYAKHRERQKAYRKVYLSRPEVKARRAAWHREQYAKNPDFQIKHRTRLYGLSPEVYAAMLNAQAGRCPGCGSDGGGRSLHIDHDHATGKVRGLLCGPCNRALGMARDSASTLRSLADYLERQAGD